MGIDYTKGSGQPSQPGQPVTLTKAAPAVSLAKSAGASGRMRINLNWQQGGQKKGLFKGKGSPSIDLDLCCLYELADGRRGGVMALGNQFGSLDGPPYCWLDGDDRSGFNAEGENLFVNLDHLDSIRRILVFAFIYQGAPNWAAAQGVVTLYPQGAGPIEVRLDEARPDNRACGIALLTNEGGALTVRREVVYAPAADHLDRHFGWGLNWSSGRKD